MGKQSILFQMDMIQKFRTRDRRLIRKKLSIVHSCVIYGCKRSPEYLFRAIRNIIDEGIIDIDDISLDFYGPEEEDGFTEDVDKYSLEKCVHFHGITPHQIILDCQRKSQILLLLTADDPIDVGCYPAKVFEYLAALSRISPDYI